MSVRAAVMRDTKPVTTEEIEDVRAVVLDLIRRLPRNQNACYRHTGDLFAALQDGREPR